MLVFYFTNKKFLSDSLLPVHGSFLFCFTVQMSVVGADPHQIDGSKSDWSASVWQIWIQIPTFSHRSGSNLNAVHIRPQPRNWSHRWSRREHLDQSQACLHLHIHLLLLEDSVVYICISTVPIRKYTLDTFRWLLLLIITIVRSDEWR